MAWLLTAQGLIIAPHLVRLPLWIGATCLVAGAWRHFATTHHWRSPGAPLRLMAVAACTAGVLGSFGTLLGRDAGTALLVLMVALKLLELNSRRDVMLLVFLGYVVAITVFLHSQAIPVTVYVFAVTVVLTAALIVVNHPGGETRPGPRLRYAGTLVLQAVPIVAVLFVLFPRVPGPLWSLPKDAHAAVTGLSESMAPGAISRLGRSREVAFRVDFAGPLPPPLRRYWRGLVLTDFDGRTWSTGAGWPRGRAPLRVAGPSVRYAVTLEPHSRTWLFALDLPGAAPQGAYLNEGFELRARRRVLSRLHYRVTSYTDYLAGGKARERRAALELPAGAAPRARRLAGDWRRRGASDAELVQRALDMFREQPFVYTLDAPALRGDSVDAFLFGTRRGFCEHYASAFTVLMRAAGVPARVVTGYQGGEFNPLGDYLIVRQSDAHAWSEVWLDNEGWVRVDPTAAISPERIVSGVEVALAREARWAITRRARPLLHHIGLLWDSIHNGWNQWVLGYGAERQRKLLARLGWPRVSWKGLATALGGGIGTVLIAVFAVMSWRQRPPVPDPVPILYQRFCDKLARIGIRRAPHEGPLDFADRASSLRPDLAGRARRITQLYIALRYGNGDGAGQLDKLRYQVGRFSARRRPPESQRTA
ncbi:MAG: DUF3488 domain-containing transglutaminase family protein [Gammaproteobacteria bacterium]|nr:DUF3488 domain-containing transglutaminase family protein [Gammaproteobacteria bacterium]NIR97861.1 DUF3488 domain-containing transglutaminase family protein [Gammaproteobacteria bacterium]NIT63566.1 DUF3488 domain-containing transglutaminase family protein [Gammaproteobacteria bacterium]NIV20502.1 DUF3488 domain-containing protein [Gammaproteobacteria bacterium]NIX11096.1 DUF3488 domain-containing protein [Gammaproteobacteria bacterium]